MFVFEQIHKFWKNEFAYICLVHLFHILKDEFVYVCTLNERVKVSVLSCMAEHDYSVRPCTTEHD